jgi:hypothetical protein
MAVPPRHARPDGRTGGKPQAATLHGVFMQLRGDHRASAVATSCTLVAAFKMPLLYCTAAGRKLFYDCCRGQGAGGRTEMLWLPVLKRVI